MRKQFFHQKDSKAEKAAKQALITQEKEEVTINEIYQYFKEIPKNKRDKIRKLEIEEEINLSAPRESGKILYQKAKQSGIKIIATSDIYFEEDVVKKMLQKQWNRCRQSRG